MSANDKHHETWFDKLAYRALGVAGFCFVLAMGGGLVYGWWNWLLTSPPLEMSCPERTR